MSTKYAMIIPMVRVSNTKETVKRMPSAKANEPNRPVKQELFLRSKVATWRLFARLLSNDQAEEAPDADRV
jgi:hypothetical protein